MSISSPMVIPSYHGSALALTPPVVLAVPAEFDGPRRLHVGERDVAPRRVGVGVHEAELHVLQELGGKATSGLRSRRS